MATGAGIGVGEGMDKGVGEGIGEGIGEDVDGGMGEGTGDGMGMGESMGGGMDKGMGEGVGMVNDLSEAVFCSIKYVPPTPITIPMIAIPINKIILAHNTLRLAARLPNRRLKYPE